MCRHHLPRPKCPPVDAPPERLPPLPKLREGAELREPPKLLDDGAGALYERLGEEFPKLRPLLLFGVNVLRGVVVLVDRLPNERCVAGRVTVERVLLCLLPKDRVPFPGFSEPKERVRFCGA